MLKIMWYHKSRNNDSIIIFVFIYYFTEVAENYKEEGILQFKYKKYRLAVANFSEGLKQNCPDNELNAQLYNNRAAANFRLGMGWNTLYIYVIFKYSI